eukprot:386479-Pelagomonas_calceolata.AAC.2
MAVCIKEAPCINQGKGVLMRGGPFNMAEFGVCAHVCFVGATHTSVSPLAAVQSTYIAILTSMELYMNVAWSFEKQAYLFMLQLQLLSS